MICMRLRVVTGVHRFRPSRLLSGPKVSPSFRLFCDGKTHVLSNQWGRQTLDTVSSLAKALPDLEMKIDPRA